MGLHSAYGIVIKSDLPLPELSPGFAEPDLVVRHSRVEMPPGMPDGARRGWADDGKVWLFCPRRGALRIARGTEILVDPAPGADGRIIRNWVIGQGLGVAMFQRGHLVFHASVVKSGGRGIAFLGASGTGKSTIAMALCRAGDFVVADDHAVVAADRQRAAVLPGFPQLKLREDALLDLEEAEGPVGRLLVSEEKLGWAVPERFEPHTVPLDRIYVLAEENQVSITPLTVEEAALALVRHSFLSSLLIKPDSSLKHQRRCRALAAQTSVLRLARPRVLAGLRDLISLLQDQTDEIIVREQAAATSA